MRVTPRTLGVLATISTVVVASNAAGQSGGNASSPAQSGPTACPIINAEEVSRSSRSCAE